MPSSAGSLPRNLGSIAREGWETMPHSLSCGVFLLSHRKGSRDRVSRFARLTACLKETAGYVPPDDCPLTAPLLQVIQRNSWLGGSYGYLTRGANTEERCIAPAPKFRKTEVQMHPPAEQAQVPAT